MGNKGQASTQEHRNQPAGLSGRYFEYVTTVPCAPSRYAFAPPLRSPDEHRASFAANLTNHNHMSACPIPLKKEHSSGSQRIRESGTRSFKPKVETNSRYTRVSRRQEKSLSKMRVLGGEGTTFHSRWISASSPRPPSRAYLSCGKSFCVRGGTSQSQWLGGLQSRAEDAPSRS